MSVKVFCITSTTHTWHISLQVCKFINPQCACAARVTIVGFVCLCVCLPVCPSVKPHLTSGVSVRPEIDVTYIYVYTPQAMKVKIFVWISLKLLHCGDTTLPPLYGYPCSPPFYSVKRRIHIVFLPV